LLHASRQAARASEFSLAPTTEPSTEPTTDDTSPTTEASPPRSLFRDPQDGAFDISGFLSSRVGFLPLAIPITEPAVGYGLGIGLTFFHDKPQAIPGENGAPPRVIMPSTTVLFGLGTENGTYGAGIAHLGVWDQGHIRYQGGLGYANLNLHWFGKGDALGGQSISYTNDVTFLFQRITFQLGDSDFHVGPFYRFAKTDASFTFSDLDRGFPVGQLTSKTSGIGAILSYDSLDQPYSPTRGIRAEISYSQQADWLGGDFNYGQLETFGIMYVPIGDQFVLGMKLTGGFDIGDAPFYDLQQLDMRGIPKGRYVDNDAVQAEAELRYDFTKRWTAVVFGGAGRVAGSVGDLLDADNHFAAGAGIRYLIARDYGLRMGVDLAHADGEWTLYVTVGTGWVRP
jgi:hypothetical protein